MIYDFNCMIVKIYIPARWKLTGYLVVFHQDDGGLPLKYHV